LSAKGFNKHQDIEGEVTIMTYSKPEVIVLGVTKQGMGTQELTGLNPEYKLDE